MNRLSGDHVGSACRPSSNVTRVSFVGVFTGGEAGSGLDHQRCPATAHRAALVPSTTGTRRRRRERAGVVLDTAGTVAVAPVELVSRFIRARSARSSRAL
jgi:hypothetical protein